ncbi:MAG TPA: hypothetical protein HA257_00385, partial [Candidatus Methanoperedenaceae archaeon]|nr:hypothetical protein [Candidatus Methanoperedenaceae archaeon]
MQGNFSARVVSEHYSASADINTKYYSNVNDSCAGCHSKPEMIIANSDPGGPLSSYANVSHYGSNKTGSAPYNVGGAANCTYCHRNTSSAFTTEMADSAWNSSIANHSALGTNPGCTNATCHGSGIIHNATITKPAVNSTFCITCHSPKAKHDSSVECSGCHLEYNKSIHPVQYL